MARSILTKNALVVRFCDGQNENGDDTFKQVRFSKIKLQATDESLLATGNAIAGLLEYESQLEVKKEELYVVGEE